MTLRDQLAEALADASNSDDKSRKGTLRLINATLKDRDVASRSAGRDPISDEEVLHVLVKMIQQRIVSATTYEENGQLELAQQERDEIAVIRELMPPQFEPGEVERVCRQVVEETDSKGLRDVGRCMNALKERYPGKMDMSKASTVVKTLLK